MLKIYVARHGQNQDNAEGILNGHRDMPLTAVGLRQAHELADGVKAEGLTFDSVYTSPLLRAKNTAEVVCEGLGIPKPVVLDALIERDFGVMTGKPIADIERLCTPDIIKTDTVTYFLSPEGAETFPMLIERARKMLAEIKEKDGSILLVTHGDFGKMLYGAYYGIPWQDMLTLFHFGNAELLVLTDETHSGTPHIIKIQQYNQ
jgi:broad specificity phosphatase PhoE